MEASYLGTKRAQAPKIVSDINRNELEIVFTYE